MSCSPSQVPQISARWHHIQLNYFKFNFTLLTCCCNFNPHYYNYRNHQMTSSCEESYVSIMYLWTRLVFYVKMQNEFSVCSVAPKSPYYSLSQPVILIQHVLVETALDGGDSTWPLWVRSMGPNRAFPGSFCGPPQFCIKIELTRFLRFFENQWPGKLGS